MNKTHDLYLSEWGEWSGVCSQTCGSGTEERVRMIQRNMVAL